MTGSKAVMALRELPVLLLGRVTRPRITVRWRLTLLYGGLFLASGAALLAITYALLANAGVTEPPQVAVPHGPPPVPLGALHQPSSAAIATLLHSAAGRPVFEAITHNQRESDLHQLLIWSAIALTIAAIASMLLGWLMARRALRPLRTITATTQQISETNLHERLELVGPRDELTRMADTIDGLLERLETAFDAQRRFVANASHELRTPLSTMRAVLDVAIAKPNVPPELTALDTNLRQGLDQADRLMESFLALARAQHGELDHAPVSLAQLASDALARRGEAIAARHIELHTTLPPGRVSGSETLLARMVDNVIENAVRYNEPHGFIIVALEPLGEHMRLLVESGGPVLERDAVARLAEPFKRLRADRTGSENGHGLGLSIVAAIAAAHNGTLELHARSQGGLRVQITMPTAMVARSASAFA
jgi:signal transduction histidine kinase